MNLNLLNWIYWKLNWMYSPYFREMELKTKILKHLKHAHVLLWSQYICTARKEKIIMIVLPVPWFLTLSDTSIYLIKYMIKYLSFRRFSTSYKNSKNYLGFEDFSLLNNGLLTALRRTTKAKYRSNHPGYR